MPRRTSWLAAPPPKTPEWDSGSKEFWHFEFEKEPVNDEKWSCIVTAAVQAEAQDDECLQIYKRCVNTGLRKAIKIITMADVTKLLKESSDTNKINKKENKRRKSEKVEKIEKAEEPVRTSVKPLSSRILELAARHAIFADSECQVPSDLMAAVLKYLILNLKNENCLQKRIDAVRSRKIRERKIKEKFIRNLKPYQMSQEEKNSFVKTSSPNLLELDEPINDEPVGGPDLYIMLTDFYDILLYSELVRINVPFKALLKISAVKPLMFDVSSHTFMLKTEALGRKKSEVAAFWEKLKENCLSVEKATGFKDIAVMQYEASCKHTEPKQTIYRTIFDELTWMQYSVYCIYRQHQKYLQELQVQRFILSLEPLDLSECAVYNKLCDALITGESLTPLLVLYAIIEQVVAGVPETKSVPIEYEPQLNDFFSNESKLNVSKVEKDQDLLLLAPCEKCRDKKHESVCDRLKLCTEEFQHSEQGEWTETYKTSTSSETVSLESKFSESFINKVISEKKTEKELREEKKWKTPSLCFFGDEIFLQTFYCDPRLLDRETLVERFLKKSDLFRIWIKYQELPPGRRAFYNFHFYSLRKISKEREDLLKVKIFFTMAMKMIGITKSCLYRGEEENISEMISGTKEKLSRVKFNKNALTSAKGDEKNFYRFFLKTFVGDLPMDTSKKSDKAEFIMNSGAKTDSLLPPHKVKSQFSMFYGSHRSSGTSFPYSARHPENLTNNSLYPHNDKVLATLYSILDCFEISNLTEPHLVNVRVDYLNLIQNFKFYEKLEPNLMIQRLIEARESFNTIQCSYFAPTDTALIITYNDFDYRGIFYTSWYGALPTPVTLRDFYNYVFPEISEWLVDENAEHIKFATEVEEKLKVEEEKKDLEYLERLKRKYCEMSEEKKKEFLNQNLNLEPETAAEDELGDLPIKPKPNLPNKLSFVATNLTDVRIETGKTIHEFHSRDGTELNVSIGTWLHAESSLLKVGIKRSKLLLYYYQWLGQEVNTSFTFKTISDIIFSFYKDRKDINYQMTISWPTGLLIQPIHYDSSIYVKQTYLKIYRKGWEIEQENSRCFLKNGQIVIFKENGVYEVLFGSGTKYICHESSGMSEYEIISTTGKVWEIRTKNSRRNRKKVASTNKIFIGVDPKTEETFYRREDGLFCMLWPNGKLVTNYPDGTKITCTPYFDEKELTSEWTEDEKIYYAQLETKYKSEYSVHEPKSRTILRNSATSKSAERQNFNVEGFVSVSCAYLMEHPKYASVYFNPDDPYTKLMMPENLKILIFPGGNYEIQQERNFLTVHDSTVEFYTNCYDCEDQTTVTLNLNSNEVLCKCVDFFKKAFFVFRTGETYFQESYMGSSNDDLVQCSKAPEKSNTSVGRCVNGHNKNLALTQRCFAFERDYSGIEFLHADSLAFYCYDLPEDTYFDINTDDLVNTFTSPYYKVGYEKWVMDYEDKDNSLPTTLKKKDLKELGAKEPPRNLFKYPFPQDHPCGQPQQNEKPKRSVNMPKLIVARTIRCLSQEPNLVIDELHKYVAAYQKRAHDIWAAYKNHKATDSRSDDSRYVEMRLRKIALTLNQSLQMYPHLCTQLPSTEKDIHYFGHFINSMEELRNPSQGQTDILPECKQILRRLPRTSDFPSIYEDSESPHNT